MAIILYHRKPDGLIHYERAVGVASAIPTTQRLLVVGPDSIPDAPAHSATAGCTVKVKALAEDQE